MKSDFDWRLYGVLDVDISRHGLHWEALDEDISIAGLLAGVSVSASLAGGVKRGCAPLGTLPTCTDWTVPESTQPTTGRSNNLTDPARAWGWSIHSIHASKTRF